VGKENVRADNGPEFVARNARAWLGRIGVKTLFIEPGGPWENGYCEGIVTSTVFTDHYLPNSDSLIQ
jgi:hypothetical protein